MDFTLKHKEAAPPGSFVAWGIGFAYCYEPKRNVLNISDARSKKPLFYVDCKNQPLAAGACDYAIFFEKATQINALILSNNSTVDLSELLDDRRLAAILEDSANLARYAYSLKQEDFKRFESDFCKNFTLKRLEIKKPKTLYPRDSSYFAKLKTLNNNVITSQKRSLHKILADLSERTLRDLIAVEFGYHFQHSTYDLLTVSSKLAIIGHILDERFIPAQRIKSGQKNTAAAKN